MSKQNKHASGNSMIRGLLVLLGVVGVFGASDPALAGVMADRQVLEARVNAVRTAMHDAAEIDPCNGSDPTVAQWYNWRNWGNWNNWPNWGNWGNWFNR